MQELDHPNIVSIYDFYQDDPKQFYMVLELMTGGELFDRIVQKVGMDAGGKELAAEVTRA